MIICLPPLRKFSVCPILLNPAFLNKSPSCGKPDNIQFWKHDTSSLKLSLILYLYCSTSEFLKHCFEFGIYLLPYIFSEPFRSNIHIPGYPRPELTEPKPNIHPSPCMLFTKRDYGNQHKPSIITKKHRHPAEQAHRWYLHYPLQRAALTDSPDGWFQSDWGTAVPCLHLEWLFKKLGEKT